MLRVKTVTLPCWGKTLLCESGGLSLLLGVHTRHFYLQSLVVVPSLAWGSLLVCILTYSAEYLRGPADRLGSSTWAAFPLQCRVLGVPELFSLNSESLKLWLVFPSLCCSLETLKAISWGNHRAHLICSPSHRGHCPFSPVSSVIQAILSILWLFQQDGGWTSPCPSILPGRGRHWHS